jgi:hypothetical protein
MRNVRLPKLLYLLPVLVALASMPRVAQAQEWAQVKGGAFAVAPAVLSAVKESLHDYVAPKLSQPREWGAYLLQYRSVHAHAIKALEIHGSCHFDHATFNVHSEFYDDSVMDGGDCNFFVYYLIKSKRYSNVLFHGLA